MVHFLIRGTVSDFSSVSCRRRVLPCLPRERRARSSPDAVFSPLPFEAWLTQNEQAHIRWTARVSAVELTNYQRLSTRVEIEVDGSELAKRRGKGQFLMLVQFNDERGGVWQYHQSIDLTARPRGSNATTRFTRKVFSSCPATIGSPLPFTIPRPRSTALLNERLHVSPLKNDPLPEAWLGLPAVELDRR